MKFLLAIIVVLLLSYFLRKSIKKRAVYYYIGAIVISIITVCVDINSLPSFLGIIFSTFFEYGTIATAMFSLVMYTNAFANGTKMQKTFMPIRAELSIIACILAYGHNLYTGKTYLRMLVEYPERMTSLTRAALGITGILVLLMTPLFITSFKCIRKKMKPKKWKQLQQLAYLFYMLIYVHVMLLMLPMALEGYVSYIVNVFVYSCVFLTYATLRLWKFYKKSKKRIAVISIIMMCLVVVLVLFYGLNNTTGSEISEESLEDVVEENSEDIVEDILMEDAEDSDSTIDEEIATEEFADEPSIYDIDLSSIPDGTYTGTGEGYKGDVVVTVTMLDGVMESITLDKYTDDESYMDKATWIRKYMMEEQKINVDAISGATYSSIGIKDAVLDALTIEE